MSAINFLFTTLNYLSLQNIPYHKMSLQPRSALGGVESSPAAGTDDTNDNTEPLPTRQNYLSIANEM